MTTMWNWKKSKASWMSHGAWMRIPWGNMEGGHTRSKHSSEILHVLMGICFESLNHLGIETCAKSLINIWHVLMGDRFLGSSRKTHVSWHAISDWSKQVSSYHQNMTCFHINLLQGPHCPCVKTSTEWPQSAEILSGFA
jgi:hypothetical protein